MTGITKPQARAAVAEAAYRRHAARNLAVLAALTGSTVAAMLAAMRVGATGLGFADVAAATFCRVLPGVSCDQFAHSVVWNLRMPRVVMGVLAGSAWRSQA